MRHLSSTFMHNLTNGFLAGLRQAAIADPDLDLQIRDNYLNLYYKGNALLKLTEQNDQRYAVQIDEKFLEDAPVPPFLVDSASVAAFLGQVPRLKQNIIRYGHSSLEIEYEQLIILIDYNPHSALLDLDGLKALPFAGQIKLFHTSFAMWEQGLMRL